MAEAEIRTVNTPCFEMDYCVFGTGDRPFIILPGMSLRPVILQARAVAGAYGSFGEKHRVYLFDRRKNMPRGYTVRDMAEDTAEAMTLLGIRDADIFGASQGGMMALCLGVYHPELVHKLALGSGLSRANSTSAETFRTWELMAERGDNVALNRDFFDRVYSKAYLDGFRELLPELEKQGTPEELAQFAISSRASADFDIYGELDRIQCPVLVLGSENDRALSRQASAETAEKLGCEFYLYEGYSHAVYDEAPDFRDRLHRFFDQ